jgi:hypothetical protein
VRRPRNTAQHAHLKEALSSLSAHSYSIIAAAEKSEQLYIKVKLYECFDEEDMLCTLSIVVWTCEKVVVVFEQLSKRLHVAYLQPAS